MNFVTRGASLREMRRKKTGYFKRVPDSPPPLGVSVRRRVAFSDVDPMGILWHGRYPLYFEQANEELGRRCDMTYADFFREELRAPIIQYHIDYFASPVLGEGTEIIARMIWNEGARMNLEYELRKESGIIAAAAYTVQMFVTAEGETCLASPEMLNRCRERWLNGEFDAMRMDP